MAALTVVAADVTPVLVIEQLTGPTGEVLTAGQYTRLNTSTGKWELGNGTTSTEVGNIKGLTLTSASPAGEAVTVLKRGLVDLGEALAGMAFGAPVYLSDTDGTLADAAGTVSTIIGYVVPAWASTTADRLLYVNL